MPTVEFEFRDMVKLLGEEFTPDDLKDTIPMLGVDLESIDHEKITLEVFPNRPDLLSVEGFARALKGKLSLDAGLCEPTLEDSGIELSIDPSVSSVRPYVVGAVLRGVILDDMSLKSLMDLQEKLHITHGRKRKKVAIGVHDLKNVMPPFRYTTAKPGEVSFIPLDMSDEMNLGEILKKHPKGREYAWILEGFGRYPVILDKKDKVLSFPPIINGELTKVSEDTLDLFIEVTGNSEKAVNQALNIIVYALEDRGGRIYSVDIKTVSK